MPLRTLWAAKHFDKWNTASPYRKKKQVGWISGQESGGRATDTERMMSAVKGLCRQRRGFNAIDGLFQVYDFIFAT